MTIVDGFPVSPELATFLKRYCSDGNTDSTFLSAAVQTITDVQDFISMKLGELDEDEKCEVANYLNDIVILKKDLIKLAKLLPVIQD